MKKTYRQKGFRRVVLSSPIGNEDIAIRRGGAHGVSALDTPSSPIQRRSIVCSCLSGASEVDTQFCMKGSTTSSSSMSVHSRSSISSHHSAPLQRISN